MFLVCFLGYISFDSIPVTNICHCFPQYKYMENSESPEILIKNMHAMLTFPDFSRLLFCRYNLSTAQSNFNTKYNSIPSNKHANWK